MTPHEKEILLKQLGNHLDDLKTIIQNTSDDILRHKNNPDTWSPKELLGHLFDVELVFSYRLRKIIEENNPNIRSFNQNIWVEEQQYNQWDKHLLVDTLISLRRNLVFWLYRIRDTDWERIANHSKRGRITFKSSVELLSNHFEHHLMQIKERARE